MRKEQTFIAFICEKDDVNKNVKIHHYDFERFTYKRLSTVIRNMILACRRYESFKDYCEKVCVIYATPDGVHEEPYPQSVFTLPAWDEQNQY